MEESKEDILNQPVPQQFRQQILQYMVALETDLKQSGRLKGGASFSTNGLAMRYGITEQTMEEILGRLSASGQVHKLGKGQWGVGKNPWHGQKREKIFRCQHCGKNNTVDITE